MENLVADPGIPIPLQVRTGWTSDSFGVQRSISVRTFWETDFVVDMA